MIDPTKLSSKDIGRWVLYLPLNEVGKLKSWTGGKLFIVFKCARNWDKYVDYTGVNTKGEDLEFITGEEAKEMLKRYK